jgi:hypothetical protein
MALLSRKARAYGKVKHAQGRASARGSRRPSKRSLAAGIGLGALAALLLDPRKRRRRRTPYDDVTLARKVETEIFRDPDAPKGRVSVNTESGVVFLRGAVDARQAHELGEAASKVDGVERVENLLHPPDEPPPES